MLDSTEVYQLFLALVPARIAAARAALAADARTRAPELSAALVPLAVDSALLGADGLSALSRAVAESPEAPREQLEAALDALEQAADELGHGDASGARVDESALLARARALRERAGLPQGPRRSARPRPPRMTRELRTTSPTRAGNRSSPRT